MTGGQVPKAKATVQAFSSLGAIIGCIVAPLLGGKIGRRPAYCGLCLASLLISQFLFRYFDAYNTFFLVAILLTGGATAAFYGWFPLYLPELFPTRVRATGQGVSFNAGRILAAGGAIAQGQLVEYFGNYDKAGAVVTLIYALGIILIWFAPETRGKPLPE